MHQSHPDDAPDTFAFNNGCTVCTGIPVALQRAWLLRCATPSSKNRSQAYFFGGLWDVGAVEESEQDRAAAGVHTNIDLNGNVSALLSFQSTGAAQMHPVYYLIHVI